MTTAERETLMEQLMFHEGVRLKPYVDTVGKVTIGCGRNLTDVGISHDEMLTLLNHDIDACVRDCATFHWFAALDPVRQRVIVDMRFQLGHAGLGRFKNTLQMVADGEYQRASAAMLKSKWAKQTPNRANRLATWMRTGVESA